MTTVFDFSADSLSGQPVELQQYKGKVLLIVNTASKCGFTPQYQGLEALHKEFAERRINMSNFRKEFFRVSLDDVEAAVARAPHRCRSSHGCRN